MQNFIRSERQCAGLRFLGFLFKCNSRKYEVLNGASANINFSNHMNRLCFLFPHQFYRKKCKEVVRMQLFSKDELCKVYYLPTLCNARKYSTNSGNHRKCSNKKKKTGSIHDAVALAKLCGIIAACLFYLFLKKSDIETAGISWSEFVNDMLLKGQVQEIKINPNYIQPILKPNATYKGRPVGRKGIIVHHTPDIKDVEQKIRKIEQRMGISMEDGISITYDHWTDTATVLDLLVTVVLILAVRRMNRYPVIFKLNDLITIKKAKYTLIEPYSGKGVRFKDVVGLQEAKVEVMEFVDYLNNPEKYTKLGAKVPKGALLLGPPGCGKTLLAKAIATESNVPFLSMNGSEFTEAIGGVGASRVRDLFAEARQRAPSIIYIDEIDAVGKKRSESEFGHGESDRTLNQLLVEMDGMTAIEDVIILASTNRADVLDKALLRPGRFDRHILIDLPTLAERIEIFEYYLKSLSLKGKPKQYATYLAQLTPGFSGAEIANVCNEAALHAANELKVEVDNEDLMYSIDKVLGGTIKKSSALSQFERKFIVYHEAGHAVAAWLLKHADPLIKVSVVPRTNKRVGFSQYSDSNLKLRTSKQLFEHMCVLLAGRVAESIMFNKSSTNAQDDLQKVTELAYRQVQQCGMSPSVGLLSFDKEYTSTKTKKPYSKKLASLMDAEVRRLITEAYKATEKLLQDNKDKLVILAEALLEKETLTYKDIEALIGPPPFEKKQFVEV